MRLSSFATALEVLYTDKMSIKRYIEVENDDGTTDNTLSTTPLSTGIKCRISSYMTDNADSNKEDFNPKYVQVKIFCSPKVGVKKGDEVTAEKLGDDGEVLQIYKGTVNQSLPFPTHQEILLAETGDA